MDNEQRAALVNFLQLKEDIYGEDAQEAESGSRSLDVMRKIFRGTPFEKTLADAQEICDAVYKIAEEKA